MLYLMTWEGDRTERNELWAFVNAQQMERASSYTLVLSFLLVKNYTVLGLNRKTAKNSILLSHYCHLSAVCFTSLNTIFHLRFNQNFHVIVAVSSSRRRGK